MRKPFCGACKRRGMVLLLSLILIAVGTALSVAILCSATLNLKMASNQAKVQQAQMAAESGLEHVICTLKNATLPQDMEHATFVDDFCTALGNEMNGTGNLGTALLTKTQDSIVVPRINLPWGGAFTAEITKTSTTGDIVCRLTVTGTSGEISRRVAVDVRLESQRGTVFDYGLASRGQIRVSGNATVAGVNDPSEGNVVSMSSQPVAIEAGGSAILTGELAVTSTDPNSVLLTGGKLSVAGVSDLALAYSDHVHIGIDPPPLPEIDITPFALLTTSVIDSSTTFSSGQTFTNVRIKAGTHPTFANTTTINGVLYIEAPNKVKFAGQTTINAIIVTEDNPAVSLSNKQIVFAGDIEAPGVDALPDTGFEEIKKHPGTILLAPGFGATFCGSANTINGTIAADQLSFTGGSSVSGTVTGTVLGLKDLDMVLGGNSSIALNRSDANLTPPGFKHRVALYPVTGSYREPLPE